MAVVVGTIGASEPDGVTVVVDSDPGGTAPESPHKPLEPGTRFGRYRIVRPIAAGGMGAVYVATDPELDREVAIKVLHKHENAASTERLLREGRAIAALTHPNVITIYDVGATDGRVFLAMELLDGQNLRDWAAAEPRHWRSVLDVFLAAGEGLRAAHEADLVHRDFKPHNVVVTDRGRVVVLDFGLALADAKQGAMSSLSSEDVERLESTAEALDLSESSERLTQAGMVLGTPAYMAPEQLMGRAGKAADQFSFCVALFEAMHGERPFGASSNTERLAKIRAGLIPGTRSEVPSQVFRVTARGLAFSQEDRWPSMDALLVALRRATRRRRWPAVALVGTAAVGVSIALGIADRPADCELEEAFAAAYDEGAARRSRESILATGLPYAPQAADLVERRLAELTRQWSAEAQRACATDDLGTQPCQRRALGRIREGVELLASGDSQVVTQASAIVGELPYPDSCGRSGAFDDDPELDARLEKATNYLVIAKPEAAVELASAVAEYAAEQGAGALEARARAILGRARSVRFETLEARAELERAFSLAQQNRRDDVATQAALYLTALHAEDLGDLEEAGRWLRHAASSLERWGPDPGVEGLYERSAADLARRLGKFDESLAHALAAQEAYERAPERFRSASLVARETVAAARVNLGEYEAARGLLEDLMEDAQAFHGADHPRHASLHSLLGLALLRTGHVDEARSQMDRAFVLVGPEGVPASKKMLVLTNLASVLKLQGQYKEALERLKEAEAIAEATVGTDHPMIANIYNNLGTTSKRLGRLDDAERYLIKALTLRRRILGDAHPSTAGTSFNLGNIDRQRGEYEASLEDFERAVRVWTDAVGPKHPSLAFALTGMGKSQYELGRLEEAEANLRRAVQLRADRDMPELLAESKFALGRVLWRTQRSVEAIRVVREARVLAVGTRDDEYIRELDDWLEQHQAADPGSDQSTD